MRMQGVAVILCGAAMMLTSVACYPEAADSGQATHTYIPADQYALAPKTPRLGMYPEFSQAPVSSKARVAALRPLPPLSTLTGGSEGGMRPIQVATGSGAGLAGAVTPGMSPGGRNPVQQLIYGGAHAMHDEPESFRFRPQDRLKLIVRDHPEFSGLVSIGQDGMFRIPNTEDVVQGEAKTLDQIRQGIAERISPYVRGRPVITLNVDFAAGGFYYVFGEVRNTGRFPMGVKPLRLSEAIFRANSSPIQKWEEESRESRLRAEAEIGGREGFSLSSYAQMSKVSVITPHRSRPFRNIYNVKSALLQGVTGSDPVLRPGQIVWVPSTFDKRLIEFTRRVIAPISAIGQLDAEASHWYGRITGNSIKGVEPKEYTVTEKNEK